MQRLVGPNPWLAPISTCVSTVSMGLMFCFVLGSFSVGLLILAVAVLEIFNNSRRLRGRSSLRVVEVLIITLSSVAVCLLVSQTVALVRTG